jgi:hypothetical protein
MTAAEFPPVPVASSVTGAVEAAEALTAVRALRGC